MGAQVLEGHQTGGRMKVDGWSFMRFGIDGLSRIEERMEPSSSSSRWTPPRIDFDMDRS